LLNKEELIFSINNSMQKISPFNQWIHESSDLDPERLIELGLFDGPVLEWWISARWSIYLGSDNPEIGKMLFLPDGLDRETAYEYRIYLSSFSDRDEVEDILYAWYYRDGKSHEDLIAWCARHLRELIDCYPPKWSGFWSGPVWCKCLNNGEWLLVEPAN
jgi:hypothetical protein